MKKGTLTFITAVLGLSLMFSSCKKDDTEVEEDKTEETSDINDDSTDNGDDSDDSDADNTENGGSDSNTSSDEITLKIDGVAYTLSDPVVSVTDNFITINHNYSVLGDVSEMENGEAWLSLTLDFKNDFDLDKTNPTFVKTDLQQLQQFNVWYKKDGTVEKFSDNTIRTVSEDGNFDVTGMTGANNVISGKLENNDYAKVLGDDYSYEFEINL